VRAVDKVLGARPLRLDQAPERVLAEVEALAEETLSHEAMVGTPAAS